MRLALFIPGNVLLLLTGLFTACTTEQEQTTSTQSYLYVGTGGGEVAFADVVTESGRGLILHNLLSGRDTQIAQSLAIVGGRDSRQLIPLYRDTIPLRIAELHRRAYRMTYGDNSYWTSFEPVFTGFPEFAREGAHDFVAHPIDWDPRDDLSYSEYKLIDDYARPLLLLGSRQRGQYVASLLVVIDSVSNGTIGGRAFTATGGPLGEEVIFEPLPVSPQGPSDRELVERVNEGYSRSSLRWQPIAADFLTTPGLPRRAIIDTDDLLGISATFLSGTEFMLLSDDHIILQGGYVLDLDKGLLTVTEEDGLIYRVFLNQGTVKLSLTVPVSVVELIDNELRGADNYLHLEVIE